MAVLLKRKITGEAVKYMKRDMTKNNPGDFQPVRSCFNAALGDHEPGNLEQKHSWCLPVVGWVCLSCCCCIKTLVST